MKKTTKSKGYKNAIKDFVHKVGSKYVDQLSVSLYTTNKYSTRFEAFAKSFNKKTIDVANDMIRYRNSMEYVYKQMGI